MPIIDQPQPKSARLTKAINQHIEAFLLGVGFLLGAVVATVAGVLT